MNFENFLGKNEISALTPAHKICTQNLCGEGLHSSLGRKHLTQLHLITKANSQLIIEMQENKLPKFTLYILAHVSDANIYNPIAHIVHTDNNVINIRKQTSTAALHLKI